MNATFALLVLLAQESTTPAPAPQPGPPVLPDDAKLLFELKDERPDHFGMGMVRLGDIDRDGVTDFYVGARCGVQGLCTGQGYGDAFSGRTGKLLWRIESEPDPEGNYFGCSVRRIEDLDGDGIAELGVNGEYLSTWKGYAQIRSGRDGRLLQHWPDHSIAFDAGDRDGDGKRDVVVSGNRGSWFANVGRTEMRSIPGNVSVSALTGDLDADGVREYLAVPEFPFEPATVRSGKDGRVLASLWKEKDAWGRTARSCSAAGDTDGDGFVDVLVTCYEHESTTRTWPASEPRFRWILISGKDGSVLRDRWEELGAKGDMSTLDLGDIDADGCSDLLVAHSLRSGNVGSRVRIRSGKDDSALVEFTSVGSTLGVTAANLGDLDGDGVPEIVLGEHEYGNCQGRAWVISIGASIRNR